MKTTFFHNSFTDLTMEGDAVVLCDIHAPYQNLDLIRKAVEYGRRYKIITVILNELYNQDEFSRFDHKDKEADWQHEKEAIKEIMYTLNEQFSIIGIHDSNHGARLKKKTAGGLLIEDIANMTIPHDLNGSVYTTDNEFIYLNDDWFICHSEEYSRVPGKKPQQIGELKGRNVIQGHSHLMTETTIYKAGKEHYYLDGGCCLDPKKVLYATSKVTTHPRWGEGFFIILEGKPIPVGRNKCREIITDTHFKDGLMDGKVTRIW